MTRACLPFCLALSSTIGSIDMFYFRRRRVPAIKSEIFWLNLGYWGGWGVTQHSMDTVRYGMQYGTTGRLTESLFSSRDV